jgi:hypothetical protein
MNERVRYRKNRIYNIEIQINFDVFYLFFLFFADAQWFIKKKKRLSFDSLFCPEKRD